MERCWKDGDKGKREFWEKSQVVHHKSQWTDQGSKPILCGKKHATKYHMKEKSEFYVHVTVHGNKLLYNKTN
jgi:hypothetical protein